MRAMALMVFILVLAPCVLAESFTVSLSSVRDNILQNETAIFKITVYNSLQTIEHYQIYSPDVEWNVATKPPEDYILKVYPTSSSETLVTVQPIALTKPGLYAVTLYIKSVESNEVLSKKLVLEIRNSNPYYGQYLPSVQLNSFVADTMDPRTPLTVRVDLSNQNTKNLSSINIVISSKLFTKTHTTSLGPLEQKSIDFTLNLDPNLPPTEDTLKVEASTNFNSKIYQFDAVPRPFAIAAYGKVTEETNIQKSIWSKKITITVRNTGNDQQQYTARTERTLLGVLVGSLDSTARVEEQQGTTYYSWSMLVEPFEARQVSITYNYWIIYLVIIIIGGSIAGYYILRSPIIVQKSSQVLSIKHGGISEIKIQIDIINRSRRQLKNVHVIDKIPNLLEYHKTEKPGLMQPDQVLKHEKKGTILKWNLGNLEPFEERVINYNSVSKLSILGGMSLPSALVSYDKGEEESYANSNPMVMRL